MATPTAYGVGTVSAATTGTTPGVPGSTVADDVLVLFAETGNEPLPAMTNWNNIGVGIVQQANGVVTALTIRWLRATGAMSGTIAVPDAGNHTVSRIVGVRGCATTGNPYEAVVTALDNLTGTAVSIPGSTTLGPERLVFAAFSTGADLASTTAVSGFANADLTSVFEQIDNWDIAGNGGGMGVATGIKAAAGAYGATTATLTAAAAGSKAMVTFAMIPPGAVPTDLVVNSLVQAQIVPSIPITKQSALVVQSPVQGQVVTDVPITKQSALVVQSVVQSQVVPNVVVSISTNLVIQTMVQGQIVPNVGITVQSTLLIQSPVQGQAVPSIPITKQSALVVQAMVQSQPVSNIIIGALGALAIQSPVQAQVVTSIPITKQSALVIQAMVQGQVVPNITVVAPEPQQQNTSLAMNPVQQAQTSSTLSLTQLHLLLIQAVVQSQWATSLSFAGVVLRYGSGELHLRRRGTGDHSI